MQLKDVEKLVLGSEDMVHGVITAILIMIPHHDVLIDLG